MQWTTMCKLVEEQGLGIMDYKTRKLWCDFMRAKYYRQGKSVNYTKSSFIWLGIKEGLKLIDGELFGSLVRI